MIDLLTKEELAHAEGYFTVLKKQLRETITLCDRLPPFLSFGQSTTKMIEGMRKQHHQIMDLLIDIKAKRGANDALDSGYNPQHRNH